MKLRWVYSIYLLFVVSAVILSATIGVLPALSARTNSQNDVQSTTVSGQIAPRLQNLGDHKFPVTTASARAQLFINQGMMLAYGFNHAEAGRSFGEAARLDPDCAMAYWGMALVLGPNINMPMAPEAEPRAYDLIRQAIALKDKASEKEQAYIDALAVRYSISGRALFRGGKAGSKRFGPRLCRGHAQFAQPLSGGSRCGHALRRGCHGSAALELLDA